MIYGYIRVSTDKQTVENQRFEIKNWCDKNGVEIDKWIEETISGAKSFEDRKLGHLIGRIKEGDTIISSEISRFGRSLLDVMAMLNRLLQVKVNVKTIKDGYTLGDDIQSKCLAFSFGLSAEIERQLISQRTKQALAMRKAAGVVLGRKKGFSLSRDKIAEIEPMLKNGIRKRNICKRMNISYPTLARIISKEIPNPSQYKELVKFNKGVIV